MKRVLNLTLERGVQMGVAFSPVLRNGCWVGEGFTDDERALERFTLLSGSFCVTDAPEYQAATPSVPAETAETAFVSLDSVDVLVQDQLPLGKGVFNGSLPEDFPGREDLLAAGYETLTDVQEASDEQLEAVKGVGPKTLKAIREAL